MTFRTIAVSAALLSWGGQPGIAQDLSPLTADDLVFSVENMDRSVDPADDFYRYATGNWLDRVERPPEMASWRVLSIMGERTVKQVAAVAAEAGREAAASPKGSATQLVGDFYNAYIDVASIEAAGMEPIVGMLAEVEAISSFDDLTRFMADQARVAGPGLFASFLPSPDPADSSRYATFATAQSFGIDRNFAELLRNREGDTRVAAYRDYIAATLEVAGYAPEEAARVADTSLAIEIALYEGVLTPEEGNDPRNRYGSLSYDEVQAQISELDLDLYFDTFGFEKPERMYMFEPRALPVVSEVWRRVPLGDLKDYVAFRVIANYAPFLSPAFREPLLVLGEALTGARIDRPREDHMYALLTEYLGHPASRLYVERFYSDAARADVLDMIARVQKVFRARIETRAWLSEPTRARALEKVDAFYHKAGYPDTWIDFSGVEIGADPVENMINLGAFDVERMSEKVKRPVEHDEFNTESTLPIAINAGYDPSINGFEVTAAITQMPAYSVEMDAPLRFCRIGAVIGHEMTHGFDSGGRRYDAEGNFRDWWTPADAAAFDREAQKLIEQGNAYEVLPGLYANGLLNVRENLADVGGITLAHLALNEYLAEHPDEDVEIDGLTPSQRCFVAWAQFWAAKTAEPMLRALVMGDPHPPGAYRATAALRHVDAFYEAFGIEEGDPMWLPPEQRVDAW